MNQQLTDEQETLTGPRPGSASTVVWVVGCFVLAGLVAGLVWWKIIDPPYFVRTSQGAVMDQVQLGRRVQADGWFMVLGVVGGLLGALVLVRRFERAPLLTLLLGCLASVGGGLLALGLGTTLGHSDVTSLARTAKTGAHIPDSLGVISHLVLVAWPIGFLVGAVAILWGTRPRHHDSYRDDS